MALDDVGVAGYRVFADGVQTGAVDGAAKARASRVAASTNGVDRGHCG